MNRDKKQLIRFLGIGFINTAVDVILFALLYNVFGLHLLLANALSTATALVVSYVLNSNYTFKEAQSSKKTFIYFMAVTVLGLWVLQPLCILVAEPFISHVIATHETAIIIAKLASIGVTLVWNYLWYSKVIFVKHPSK